MKLLRTLILLSRARDQASKSGAPVLPATRSAEAAAIADARVHLRDGRIQSIS
jgi:hypothetical protein